MLYCFNSVLLFRTCTTAAVPPSLAPTLVNVRVTELFEFSMYLLVFFILCCTFCSSGWVKDPIVGIKRRGCSAEKETGTTNQ